MCRATLEEVAGENSDARGKPARRWPDRSRMRAFLCGIPPESYRKGLAREANVLIVYCMLANCNGPHRAGMYMYKYVLGAQPAAN